MHEIIVSGHSDNDILAKISIENHDRETDLKSSTDFKSSPKIILLWNRIQNCCILEVAVFNFFIGFILLGFILGNNIVISVSILPQ